MNDNELYREGMREQLLILEDLEQSTLGDPEAPLVCTECFTKAEDCACTGTTHKWPVSLMVGVLRARLERDGTSGNI